MPYRDYYPPPVEDTAIRSYAEVAAILGVQRDTVMHNERKALDKIGKALVRWAKREGTTIKELTQ